MFKVEEGVEILASLVKPPVALLSVRVVFGAQYYFEYPDKHEYIIIFSNRGNEELIEEYKN